MRLQCSTRMAVGSSKTALEQVARYLDAMGVGEGWLVMFDLRSTKTWDERLTTRTVEAAGKRVHVVGC